MHRASKSLYNISCSTQTALDSIEADLVKSLERITDSEDDPFAVDREGWLVTRKGWLRNAVLDLMTECLDTVNKGDVLT